MTRRETAIMEFLEPVESEPIFPALEQAMAIPTNSDEPCLPESNVESVVDDLVHKTVDLDGTGLVHFFRTLLERAEEFSTILEHSERATNAMLLGDTVPTQPDVDAQLLDTLYQTTCLKWFLAVACKKLADELEYDVHRKQSRSPRIRSVVYGNNGDVEAFTLAPKQEGSAL